MLVVSFSLAEPWHTEKRPEVVERGELPEAIEEPH